MYTGDMISGTEAARIHLVNKAVPAAELMAEARRLAAKLARVPVPAIKFNKAAINHALLLAGLHNSWLFNAETTAELHCTEPGRAWMRRLYEQGLAEFLRAREAPFEDLDG
jgi:enoyl-CoA hydratase/carnithine racemase